MRHWAFKGLMSTVIVKLKSRAQLLLYGAKSLFMGAKWGLNIHERKAIGARERERRFYKRLLTDCTGYEQIFSFDVAIRCGISRSFSQYLFRVFPV